MFRNYLKIAWRNLVNQRMYSLLNLAGLSIGLTCVLVITLYLKNELTFDAFHDKADRIYRLTNTTTNEAGTEIKNRTGNTGAIQGPAFAAAIPEIETVTRMQGVFFNVRRGNEGFYQDAHYVDANFFQTFSLPLLRGTVRSALGSVHSVVLTETGATKYFGTTNAMGQLLQLEIDGEFEPFVVTGITEDPQPNSSLQFEMLLPFGHADSKYKDENWLGQYLATFIVLRAGTSPGVVERKIDQVFSILGRAQVAQAAKERGYREQRQFGLQPLTDIHLTLAYGGGNELAAPASPATRYILGGIAVFMLLIACINFVNLTVARSLRRAREVGVRKVIGGKQNQLVTQFLSESFLISLIAFVLAILLACWVLPFFNVALGQHLRLGQLFDRRLVVLYGGLLVLTTLLAGSYPAFILSRFEPAKVLYSRLGLQGKNYFGNSLVVVQFALSVGLIVATLVVFAQFDFMTTKNLGYDPSRLVGIELPVLRNGNNELAPLFRQKLMNQPGVVNVTAKNWLDEYTNVRTSDKELTINYLRIDKNYLPALGIQLRQGRNFSELFAGDTLDNALVNESFVREAGWQNPLGQRVVFPERNNKTYRVIGVVNDYHFSSLHEPIRPQVFVGDANLTFGEIWVKIQPNNINRTLALLGRTYQQLVPNHYYHYQFQESIVAKQYETDMQLRRLITWATGLCLFIACLGIFGLAAFTAEQRTKEIGIRKVMGASISSLVALLSKDFLKLVLVAIIIASPIAYSTMNRWLSDFAYRIDISWWVFTLAGLVAIVIALLTVSFQSVKAALMNPVKSLRSE